MDSETVLDIHKDTKTPHSYLAVRLILEAAPVNFLPYTVSNIDFGLTTSAEGDMKLRPENASTDEKQGHTIQRPGNMWPYNGCPFERRIGF